ncbi:MAG: hypothetical protein BM556_06940 [Bacteriovorax sp. MedPE-SWde]|nr:MAG: hypothetical protein BM556_06940 [Bacteriovorax sp. MedPE-SWde]
MSKIHKNWITIIIFLIFSTALYFRYELELYTYLCEEESNAPACFVLYKEYSEREMSLPAKRYLKVSCEKEYELACNELEKSRVDESR